MRAPARRANACSAPNPPVRRAHQRRAVLPPVADDAPPGDDEFQQEAARDPEAEPDFEGPDDEIDDEPIDPADPYEQDVPPPFAHPYFPPVVIAMTTLIWTTLETMRNSATTIYGMTKLFRNYHHFDKGRNGIASSVSSGGLHLYVSSEQSNKCAAAADTIATCRAAQKPVVLNIKEKKCNASEVATKVSNFFGGFPAHLRIATRFMDGRRATWERLASDPMNITHIMNGQLVLVVPSYTSAQKKLFRFLHENGIHDVTIIYDEGDDALTQKWSAGNLTDFSKAFRKLICAPPKPESPTVWGKPFSDGSLVRTLVILSATHFASPIWARDIGVPVRVHLADREAQVADNYAIGCDLRLVVEIKKDKTRCCDDYGWNSCKMKEAFQLFNDDKDLTDTEDPGPSRPRIGRLMLHATTPYVNQPGKKDPDNPANRIPYPNPRALHTQASETVKTRCRDAVCFVVCCNGIFRYTFSSLAIACYR